LTFSQEGETVYLRGPLKIADLATFEIEIIFPDDYPASFPEVNESSNKIPVSSDRHINGDGTCCLSVPAMMHTQLGQKYSIVEFIQKFVEPFLANQLYFEIHGTWKNGDYSHGDRGILECYEDLLKIKGLRRIVSMMHVALQTFPKIRKKCPCGSGKPLRKCHFNEFVTIKTSIPRSILESDYRNLVSHLS
jgi:hypothetical protein